MIVEPKVFGDARGFFWETWSAKRYAEAGIRVPFVQDNVSYSRHGVLRGMHFQNPSPQAKLVTVLRGTIFDVVADIRLGSPTFGQWMGVELKGETGRQLFIPVGLAHGFCVTGDEALFSYKCSDYYAPAQEQGIAWNDPDIGIVWPVKNPILSDKDCRYVFLRDFPKEQLPVYG